jgi:hypothetical protein
LTRWAAPPEKGGFAIISVMVVMTLIFLTLGAVLNHRYTVESDQVEQSLVKVRGYWAMVGALDWTLARCRKDGAAGCNDFDNAATGFSAKYGGYFAELTNPWTYSANETYNVNAAAIDPAAGAGGLADGSVTLTVTPSRPAAVMPLKVGLTIDANGKSSVWLWDRTI